MHAEAYAFVRRTVAALPPRQHVVDLGGRDVNGSARDLFPGALYISVDLCAGKGVDVVADAARYRPRSHVDTVLCLEVLEHAKNASAIVKNAYRILEPRGVLIATMATEPRAPHSATGQGSPARGEFYRNVNPTELWAWLTSAGFADAGAAVGADRRRGDLYCAIQKGATGMADVVFNHHLMGEEGFSAKAREKWTVCDTCGRLLARAEGPTCPECAAKARSESAKRGAETRRANAEEAEAEDAAKDAPERRTHD